MSTAILIYSAGTALPVANALGSFLGNIAVDLVEFAYGADKTAKGIIGNAIAQAAVAGLAAKLWGDYTPDGRAANDLLGQYQSAIARAVEQKTPPTFPFETPEQVFAAFAKYQATKLGAQDLFGQATKKMVGLMLVDGFATGALSQVPSVLATVFQKVSDGIQLIKQNPANQRVYGS